MAKVRLENTRGHDITLMVRDKETGETLQATVPMAREVTEDGKKALRNGEAEVDDAILAAAKTNPACKAYFADGWLIEPKNKGGRPPKAKDETE